MHTDTHSAPIRAYHFTSDKLRDGSPIPPIGETLKYKGWIHICESGLHASRNPFDAMWYAPGMMLHLVEVTGDVEEQDDKLVGRERTILASIDATELLREFVRWCALQVIDEWDAPDVVRQYLETGDESLREAAREAGREAGWAAAREAAWAAAVAAWSAADAAWFAADAGHVGWTTARDVARAHRAARAAQRDKFTEMVEDAFTDSHEQEQS